MDTVIAMLQHYSFDLGGYTTDDLARVWSKYEPSWVRLAIVESLFQGRYKAVSVNQILTFWERKGEPHCRFNREFERLVCGDFVTASPSGFSNHPQKVVYKTPKSETPKAKPTISRSAQNSSSQIASEYIPIPHRQPAQRIPANMRPTEAQTPLPPSQKSRAIANSPSHVSDVYQSALENMQLFADASLFVDKLRSMCQGSEPLVSLSQGFPTRFPSNAKTEIKNETKVLVEVGVQTDARQVEAKIVEASQPTESPIELLAEAKNEDKVEAIADA
jgi:hypothetical protein